MKSKIVVTVLAEHNSGSTTIMSIISEALKEKGIETLISWGVDGPPQGSSPAFKVEAVAKKSQVSIIEFQAPRRRKQEESADDFKVIVEHSPSVGYSTVLSMMGRNLRHDFGNEYYSQEQARALASRLATELGVDVVDKTRNIHDWVQPR